MVYGMVFHIFAPIKEKTAAFSKFIVIFGEEKSTFTLS